MAERRSVFPGFADLAPGRHPLIDQLVDHRHDAGLSQADVARRMGTSQPAVARLEAGGTDVRLSTLGRYAAAVGLDLGWRLAPRPEEDTR